MLGLPRAALERIGGWRSDLSSSSPARLASLVAPDRSMTLRGPALQKDARRLALPIQVRGTEIGVVAYIRAPDGSFVPLRLGRNHGPRPQTLGAGVPAAARGGSLVAFRFEPPPRLEETGANAGAPAVGTVTLGRPLADGKPITGYGDWTGTVGVAGLSQRNTLRFRLTLTNEVDTYVRPRQPTDGTPLPAVVSPRMAELAGPDRLLGVVTNGEPVTFRVAAVASRFPGIPQSETSDFVVADRSTLDSALNTSTPGSGFPTELWLNARSSALPALHARLRRPPFTVLSVSSRSAVERSLRSEPVSRAALAMLEAAALTAVVLSLLVVRFVELTANATAPEPPLLLSVDWPAIVLAALAAALVAVALVSLATGRAFRGAVPPRYGETA